MCSMSVLCPLCAQTSFTSIDALRCSLIKAANGPLACPICHELFLGLDKLTIHLFSHTNIMNSDNTTTTSNQNYNEKLKTKQIENPNNINNNNNNTNATVERIKENLINELNFENVKPNEEKKPKVFKTEKKKINKLNSTQQQQVVLMNERHQQHKEQEEDETKSKEIENLATCDICEFTFRNEELRDMHIRLVHQNFIYEHGNNQQEYLNGPTSQISDSSTNCVGLNQNSPLEHDFKCHLCSKTFKMKGSLRVHLKVVHLIGLPHVNNTPKLNICERIRHKENKILKSSTSALAGNQVEIDSINASALNNNNNNSNNTNNLFNIVQPVNFLASLNAASNLSVVNILHPEEFPQNSMENSQQLNDSNVLLVFNQASADMAQNINLLSQTHTSSDKELPSINNCSLLPATTTTSSLSNATENPKIWECDVCSKAFTTKYFLKKHKRLHTGEMPYTCELCARTFTFQQSYHKHLLYHSDEKPHVCSTCGRAFKELSTLHNHERIHSGEKPFKCEICGKSFRQRVSFLVHTRIHTGVMPYKCEICQKSFRYKVSQRTHKCQPLSPEQSPSHETIDHLSENFIKAFLETSTNIHQSQSHLNHSQNSPASNEIAAINEKSPTLNEQQALLSKTIDDIVVESCNKMGIGSNGFTVVQNDNEGSMSPSQKLQNMRLYSPQLVTPDLNGIDGDLTRFFLEHTTQSGNNLL